MAVCFPTLAHVKSLFDYDFLVVTNPELQGFGSGLLDDSMPVYNYSVRTITDGELVGMIELSVTIY